MEIKKLTYLVSADETGLRLDKFLHQRLTNYSRTFHQKLIEQKNVTVNGKTVKPSFAVSQGDCIEVNVPIPDETEIQPQNIPLSIVYQDQDIIVIDKPAGIVVHPGAGVRSGTIVNALLYHCKDLSGVGGRLRPGIVHRLDKNTSGLMVVAKNDQAHLQLAQQLADKTMKRKYQALVWHLLEPREGRIETFLNRSKRDRKIFTVSTSGKKAITLYEVEKYFQFLTLVNMQLETGRTHQIRTHFNHIHHPVFGDPEYNGRNKQLSQLKNSNYRQRAQYLLSLIHRQALHAVQLSFIHPTRFSAMNFTSPLPADFQRLLDELKNEGTTF